MVTQVITNEPLHQLKEKLQAVMIRNWWMSVVIFCFVSVNMTGQSLAVIEDSLVIYAESMQTAKTAAERREAGQHTRRLMTQALNNPESRYYPFSSVPQISIINDPTEKFRLISWQVSVDSVTFQHYGFIQPMSGRTLFYVLRSRAVSFLRTEDRPLNANEWIGQIYYKIHPFKHKKKQYWVLFGYSSHNGVNARKYADILYFEDDGTPGFGKPLFVYHDQDGKEKRRTHRIELEYTAESQVRLSYDGLYDMILFDNLQPFANEKSGGGLRYIPDGTYSGFKLVKGEWHFVDKVFHEVMEEAPVPVPVLDKRKTKDIMGKEKTEKKP